MREKLNTARQKHRVDELKFNPIDQGWFSSRNSWNEFTNNSLISPRRIASLDFEWVLNDFNNKDIK